MNRNRPSSRWATSTGQRASPTSSGRRSIALRLRTSELNLVSASTARACS
ncbi:hypothetical protein AB0F91_24180 [Amycolatopsis sp. NPDC023774]